MSIEKERKIILIPNESKVVNFFTSKMVMDRSFIVQGYLSKDCRIRKRSTRDKTEYFFTYKKGLDETSTVEIETQISEEDFSLLLPTCEDVLTKTRYTKYEKGVCWDLDIFFDPEGVYFCMLEVEYEDKFPSTMFIPDELVLWRAITNSEYSSRKLCDRGYAEKKLKELGIDRKFSKHIRRVL